MAIGANATATAANSVALGAGSVADDPLTGAVYNPGAIALAGSVAAGEVSIGDAGAERRLTNVAAGSADTDAATIGQLRSLGATLSAVSSDAIVYDDPSGAVSTLRGTGGTRITNLAAGTISAASTDAVNGSQLNATNQALAELSSIAVVYDVDQQGQRTNGVTLQGGNSGQPVAVHNVARGEAPTDAVNVAQLDEGLENGRRYADSVVGKSVDLSRAYTDEQVGAVREEARQAAAIGLAASSLRFDGTPGKVSFGASGGVWRGESAFAAGVGYTHENGRLRANATATTAGGAWGAGGGFTMTLN